MSLNPFADVGMVIDSSCFMNRNILFYVGMLAAGPLAEICANYGFIKLADAYYRYKETRDTGNDRDESSKKSFVNKLNNLNLGLEDSALLGTYCGALCGMLHGIYNLLPIAKGSDGSRIVRAVLEHTV